MNFKVLLIKKCLLANNQPMRKKFDNEKKENGF